MQYVLLLCEVDGKFMNSREQKQRPRDWKSLATVLLEAGLQFHVKGGRKGKPMTTNKTNKKSGERQ